MCGTLAYDGIVTACNKRNHFAENNISPIVYMAQRSYAAKIIFPM